MYFLLSRSSVDVSRRNFLPTNVSSRSIPSSKLKLIAFKSGGNHFTLTCGHYKNDKKKSGYILFVNTEVVRSVNYVNLKRSSSVDRQTRQRLISAQLHSLTREEGFLLAPYLVSRYSRGCYLANRALKLRPPPARARHMRLLHTAYVLNIVFDARPVGNPSSPLSSRLLSLTSPSRPLTDPSSPLAPLARLRQVPRTKKPL